MDATWALMTLGGCWVVLCAALAWRAQARSDDRDDPPVPEAERMSLHDRLAPLVDTEGEPYPVRRGLRRRRHRDGLVAGADGVLSHGDALAERPPPG